jgi:NAD(P)-dependent dehydrogenase (short-subunit alcohol dehydrogenase family)
MSILRGKVAIITGASRGIGRECALGLAKRGCNVVIAAKSAEPQPNLPGTIYSVAEEIEALGVQALPLQVDIRDAEACAAAVETAAAKFGRVDVMLNNASALWWQDIVETPIKKFDLITGINCRGAFAMTQACLPHMAKGGYGRVITMSPPIQSDFRAFGGFTAYNISKMGMTMVAMGAAAEGRKHGITGHSLWPATVVESTAATNFKLGDSSIWRKATILSDCVVKLCEEPDDYTGRQLIDDEYLRERHGFDDADFVQYRFNPDVEPPRLLARPGDATPRRRSPPSLPHSERARAVGSGASARQLQAGRRACGGDRHWQVGPRPAGRREEVSTRTAVLSRVSSTMGDTTRGLKLRARAELRGCGGVG